MNLKRLPSFLTLIALGLYGAYAFSSPKTDQAFVTKAAQSGMAEAELGRLASAKASDVKVKAFGQLMVADHRKANQDLMDVAKKSGFMTPDAPTAAQRAIEAELKALEGKAFDQRFAEVMVKDHDETVALFEEEARTGMDPEIKTFAAQTLPTLRHHREMAKELQKSLEGSRR